MTEQDSEKQLSFKQKLDKSIQNTIKRQIIIEDEKIKRKDEEYKKREQRMMKKSLSQQFIKEEQQQLEVPIDGEIERGSKLFMIHCSPCHNMQHTYDGKSVGPALGLLYNRRIGSDSLYLGYSQGMMKEQSFWTARNLYNFMYSPQNFIRGTFCKISKWDLGLKQQQDRADLIVFLRQYSSELYKNLRIQQVKKKSYIQYQTEMHAKHEQARLTSNYTK